MKNPEINPNEQELMGNREAQEEALMIEQLQDRLGTKLTVEDYDRALKVVEEMKKAAELEPDILKQFNFLARFINKSRLAVEIFVSALFNNYDHGEDQWHFFEDAAYRLKRLKSEAIESGRYQKMIFHRKKDEEEKKKAA